MCQARHIQSRLAALYPRAAIEIFGMTTEGDRRLGASLAKIGGKGLFVKEIEEALERGAADIAVHSMKDVPVSLPPGFTLPAVTEREDARDAFVSRRFREVAALPPGSRVGTSSLRRMSQLKAHHPALAVEPLRGNVPTRLRKLDEGQFSAVILAVAGLKRLGLAHRVTAVLSPEESLPAVGQGAIGIECRAERRDLIAALEPLNHRRTALCVRAERALSRALAGSCNVPLAGFAEIDGKSMHLRGFVGVPDGSRHAAAELTGPAEEPEALGQRLAERLRAQGADAILAALEST